MLVTALATKVAITTAHEGSCGARRGRAATDAQVAHCIYLSAQRQTLVSFFLNLRMKRTAMSLKCLQSDQHLHLLPQVYDVVSTTATHIRWYSERQSSPHLKPEDRENSRNALLVNSC